MRPPARYCRYPTPRRLMTAAFPSSVLRRSSVRNSANARSSARIGNDASDLAAGAAALAHLLSIVLIAVALDGAHTRAPNRRRPEFVMVEPDASCWRTSAR